MDTQRVYLQAAFVLHQRAYADSSAILEAFSRDYGRVGIVARGVRSGRSRRQGALQPFGELLLSWTARGELATLTAVEPVATPRDLKTTRLVSGFYLNELLMRLLRRDDPHPEVYDDYRWAIDALAGGVGEPYLLRVFEKRLLERLGYGLLLEQDAAGADIDPDALYRYRIEQGPERAAGPAGERALPGQALLALARESADIPRFGPALMRLTRAALAPHLGEQPLRSRELYRQFRRPPPSQEKTHD